MATEQNRIAQPPDRYRLQIASEKPSVYELNRPLLRLGMDLTCEMRIKRDRTVSPVHATFYMRDGAWCLRDESSRHGISWSPAPGSPPPTRYAEVIGLAPGQTFRFGPTNVVFQRIRPPGELVEAFCGMVGTSPALRELTREIERIARRAKRPARGLAASSSSSAAGARRPGEEPARLLRGYWRAEYLTDDASGFRRYLGRDARPQDRALDIADESYRPATMRRRRSWDEFAISGSSPSSKAEKRIRTLLAEDNSDGHCLLTGPSRHARCRQSLGNTR